MIRYDTIRYDTIQHEVVGSDEIEKIIVYERIDKIYFIFPVWKFSWSQTLYTDCLHSGDKSKEIKKCKSINRAIILTDVGTYYFWLKVNR